MWHFSSFLNACFVNAINFGCYPLFRPYFPAVKFISDPLMNGMKIEISKNFELVIVAHYHLSIKETDDGKIFDVLLLKSKERFFGIDTTESAGGDLADIELMMAFAP